MAISSSYYYFFLMILCVALFNPTIRCYADAQTKSNELHKLLFVFGDSLFDAGNSIYLEGGMSDASAHWPYGIDFHNHSTGRICNGLIVPDFIALFAQLQLIPPYLQPHANFVDGANFASAASGVLDIHPGVINLNMQLSNFKKLVESYVKELGVEKAKKMLMRCVYLFSTGGNDYTSFATNSSNATLAQMNAFTRMVIGNLSKGLQEIHELGGRKIAFQNVGPLGCLPLTKQTYSLPMGKCDNTLLLLPKLHNEALSNALKNLEKKLPGFKYSIFDYHHSLRHRINHPKKYIFKIGSVACCGNGLYNASNCGNSTSSSFLCSNRMEYVFWDGGHTTEHANHQLAKLPWSGKSNVTAPYTLKQLFEFP